MTSKEKTECFLIHDHDDVDKIGKFNDLQCGSLDEIATRHVDTRCGMGPCKPGNLQMFANMTSFAIYYGLVALVTTALTVYLGSQVTTLEKQFGLSGSELGLLLSMNDIGFLTCAIAASHLFRYYHKPRVLAICTLIYGISAIVSAIPQFVTPSPDNTHSRNSSNNMSSQYMLSSREKFEGESLCFHGKRNEFRQNLTDPEYTAMECNTAEAKGHDTARAIALGLISIGLFFQGVAKAPRLSMIQTYIDDNVVQTKTGFYIGLIACLTVFGPVIAFAIGAGVSRIYVTLEETDMLMNDPRWIGAWWLGFIVFGIVALMLAMPLFFFPKRMSITTKNCERKAKEVERRREIASKDKGQFMRTLKDLPKALFRLLTNMTYVFIVVAGSLEFFTMAGRLAFTPKYLEVHFVVSTFKANMLTGSTALVAASAGLLVGGIITTKMKLQLIGCIKLIVILRGLSVLIGAASLSLVCPQPHIKGLQLHGYGQLSSQLSGQNTLECSSGCSCHSNAYFPVCGSDDINYFSPCVAGCSSKEGYQYGHCTCVSNMTFAENITSFTAKPGLCSRECDSLSAYVVVSVLATFLATSSGIPVTVAILRCVSERDKSIAVGVSTFVSSLLGWFLGPVLYGRIIDSSCQMWHTSCSKLGACAIYNVSDLRIKFHGVGSAARLMGVLLFIACLLMLLCKAKREEINRVEQCVPNLRIKGEEKALEDDDNVEDDA